jgi:hypothetical protein
MVNFQSVTHYIVSIFLTFKDENNPELYLRSSLYHAVNMPHLCYKSQSVLYREIITVSFEMNTKHKNKFCVPKGESLVVKPGGT